MKFRLIYDGAIPSRTRCGLGMKQHIREALSPQLARLWEQPPLSEHATRLRDTPHSIDPADDANKSLRHEIKNSNFVALVSSRIHLVAELDVLILRQQPAGRLIRHGGDLDNRTKTLLDSLRLPSVGELPVATPANPPVLTYVLLEDDALVTRLNVEVDQLLGATKPDDMRVVISVTVRRTKFTWDNAFF